MKKKMHLRILSALMTIMMMVSVLPLSVFAVSEQADIGIDNEPSEEPINMAPIELIDADNGTSNEILYDDIWDGSAAVGFASGSGRSDDPYIIKTGAQLKYFANQVNGGDSYLDQHIKLNANLDLNGLEWLPIGILADKPFSGNFDGNGHEIASFTITHESDVIDSTTQYIGFFGYTSDATISNVGVYNYKIDCAYNYDTIIGGFVACAEGSIITDCYVNGHIFASLEQKIPFDRADAITLTSISDIPKDFSGERYSDVHGKGVIIDLSNVDSCAINKTLQINNYVTAVKFIGKKGATYSNFNITIEANDSYNVYLEFVNFNLIGNSKSGTIVCNSSRQIYICSSGDGNFISTLANASAIYAPVSDVFIVGEANLELVGGNGGNATNAGTAGADGYSGINVDSITADICGTLIIRGGNGGNGAQGITGNTGSTNNSYTFDRNVYGIFGIEIQWISHYNQAYQGGMGGKGGNGGNGGVPAVFSNINIIDGKIKLIYGNGGNGGKGGTGGTGGKGHDYYGTSGGVSYLSCYDPGKGGKGGTGGAGGDAGRSVTRNYSFEGNSIEVISGFNGRPGDGGFYGYGGVGGNGGSTSATANNHSAPAAASGEVGDLGELGGIISEYDSSVIGVYNKLTDYDLRKLLTAYLIVGGFVGQLSGSEVKNCATVAEPVIDEEYNKDKITKGYFVGRNNGVTDIVIASFTDEDGLLCKYETELCGLGNDVDDSKVSVLNNNKAENGVVYSGMFNDNQVQHSRQVIGLASEHISDITIADYVFSGRNIAIVDGIVDYAFDSTDIVSVDTGNSLTKIGIYAFNDCILLSKATLNDAVSEIGAKLFAGCSSLQTVFIGKKLTDIPDIENHEVPFGINKATSSLSSYIVSPNNPTYRSIDGILYELFYIDETFGSVPVAVIDVPVNANISNFTTEQHVVKIYPNAFSYNKKILSVKLDYIREVGDSAFKNAVKLAKVQFGSSVETDEYITTIDEKVKSGKLFYNQVIGVDAFKGCTALCDVDLGSEFITKIGTGAFENCATNSAQALDIVIGKNVESIGCNYDELYNDVVYTDGENLVKNSATVFKDSNVSSIAVKEGNKNYLSIDGVLYLVRPNHELTLIIYPKNKVDTSFSIPNVHGYTVTRIGKDAFFNAQNLSRVIIDKNVVTIDNGAFKGSKIYSIYIGSDVAHIATTVSEEKTVFDGCSNLTAVEVSKDNAYYASVDGILYNKDVTRLIKYPQNKNGYEFDAPTSVGEVAASAFSGNQMIRRITFESEIASVGGDAFKHCSNVSIIYFKIGAPMWSSRTAIEESGTFETDNPRTIICYSDNIGDWERLEGDYFSKEGIKLYSVQEFQGYPTDKVANGYYAFVVVDKGGNPINDIYVELSYNYEDGSSALWESVPTQAGIATFYNPDFSVDYSLRVVDNLGEYFPFENTEFYLDNETRITYITLSSVPTVSGVNVSYSNKKADDLGLDNEFWFGGASNSNYLFVGGTTKQTYDFNSEAVIINKWLVKDITTRVEFGCDPDTTVAGYYIIQNGVKLLSFVEKKDIEKIKNIDNAEYAKSMKQLSYVDIPIPTGILRQEQDLYVAVVFAYADGSTDTVTSKLNLHIIDMELMSLDMSIATNEFKLTIDKNIPIIGGAAIEISESMEQRKKNPFNIDVLYGPDFYRIIIKDGKFQSFSKKIGNNYDENYSQSLEQFAEAWAIYSNSGRQAEAPLEAEHENKLTLSWSGYIEVKYKGLKEDGKPDYAVSTSVTGTIKYTFSGGTTIQVVCLPVRLEYELNLKGDLTFKLVFDKEANQFCTPNVEVEFKLGVDLFAGIGCKLISVGIYGNVEMVIVLDLYKRVYEDTDADGEEEAVDKWFHGKKWTLEGDAGVRVQYNGLFVKWKYEWSFFHNYFVDATSEWVIFEDGYWWYQDGFGRSRESGSGEDLGGGSRVRSVNSLYQTENYTLARSPMMLTAANHEPVQLKWYNDSDYSGTTCKLVQVGDIIYIIYTSDVNGYENCYDDYNYQKLLVQTYNIDTGEYSDPFILDNNGLSDCAFDVIVNGDKVIVEYSQLNRVLSEADANDIEGYVGSIEIKIATIDTATGSVTVYDALTSDEYYDLNPKLSVVDGQVYATWIKNEDNSMFAETENGNSIYGSLYVPFAGIWSPASIIRSGINTITDYEFDGATIAFITDTNNDLATVGYDEEKNDGYTDKVIHVIDVTGTEIISTEENAYFDISYIDGNYVYYLANNLYVLDDADTTDDTPLLAEAISDLTEEYYVMTDKDGAAKAILFVVNTKNDAASYSDLYGIFKNGEQWGKPICLTDHENGEYVSSFTALDLGNKALYAILNATDGEPTGDSITDDSGDEYGEMDYTYDSKAYPEAYPSGYTADSISVDYDSLIAGYAKISIRIANSSADVLNIGTIPFSVKYGDTICDIITISAFFDAEGNTMGSTLLSGEDGYVDIVFDPGVVSVSKYDVTVGEDIFADVQLWYSDIAVYGKQVVIGGQYYIVARIANEGFIASNELMLAVNGSAPTSGEENAIGISDDIRVDALNPGESKYLTMPIDNSMISDNGFLFMLNINADDEVNVANNSKQISVSNTPESGEINIDSLRVWIDADSRVIDRTYPSDIHITYDDNYDFVDILINGTLVGDEFYSMEGDQIILNAEKIAEAYANGTIEVTFEFNGLISSTVQIATLKVNLTQTIHITWNVDGKEIVEKYEYGQMPSFKGLTSKDSDDQYTYIFDGWDREIVSATSDMTYTATYRKAINAYDVTWIVEGNLTHETYEYGNTPSFGGTPEKSSTEKYDYVFAGWKTDFDEAICYDDIMPAVTGDVLYIAVFDEKIRSYTVTWVVDGKATEQTYEYGAIPDASDIDTEKESDIQYSYTFSSWNKQISEVIENTTYIATYTKSINQYVVTWVVNESLEKGTYNYGDIPTYIGELSKPEDKQYTYTFKGWDKEIDRVKGDVTYTACFEPHIKSYTVTWNINGEEFAQRYEYGTTPVYEGMPTRESSYEYYYVFSGWDKAVTEVITDITYTACFEAHELISADIQFAAFGPDSVSVGDEVKYRFTVSQIGNLSGIYGLSIDELKFDSFSLKYIGIELIQKPSDSWLVLANDNGGYLTIIVADNNIQTPATAGDISFEVTFVVTNKAVVGDDVSVALTKVSGVSEELESVAAGNASISSTVTEAATLQLNESLNFSIDLQNNYLTNVQALTAKITLLSAFANESGNVQIIDLNGDIVTDDNAYVGAGFKVQLVSSNQVIDELTVIVAGDTNGDGRINTTDYLRVRGYYIGSFELNSVQIAAADVNGDGKINTTDYLRIRNHYLGTFNLYAQGGLYYDQ